MSSKFLKYILYTPYCSAMAAGNRSCDYMRFLGVPKDNIMLYYNCRSLKRIREQASATYPIKFSDRHFTVVARFVEKKNLFMTLDAYTKYLSINSGIPRMSHLAGFGPLDEALRSYAANLGIDKYVVFHGFIQTEEISNLLKKPYHYCY